MGNKNKREEMKAIVYTGPGWIWCERVKVLLTNNGYEVDERPVQDNVEVLFALNNNEHIRSIPQVVIDGKLIGGYKAVETIFNQIQPINNVVW